MAVFVLAWLIYLPRFLLGLRYKPISNGKRFDVTAVVTSFKEDLVDFERCLKSLKESLDYGTNNYEIIVVIDGLTPDEENDEYRLAQKYATTIIKHNNRNKRRGIALALQNAKYDLILSSDSDTFYERDTVFYLMQPFDDESVGGVTSAQRIYNPTSVTERTADWMEHARLYASLPAASYYGQVGCLPGRAIAWRKHFVTDNIDEYTNEYFFGKLCISGDDRVVTNIILRSGYKTLLQSNARVQTLAPKVFGKWFKQQLRWSRSSQRYTIQCLPWLIKKPMAAFVYISDFFMTLLVNASIIAWIVSIVMGNMTHPILILLGISLLSMTLNLLSKHFGHIRSKPVHIFYIPLFAILATILQVIRLYGLITLWRVSTWGTRPNSVNKTEFNLATQ
jgi:hyaluronan synthase